LYDYVTGEVCVSIADITIGLACEDPEFKLRVQGATKDFLVDEGEPDVSIRAAWGDLSKERGGRNLFEASTLWQLYRVDGFYLFRFTSRAFGSIPYKVASFNPDFTSGIVHLHRPFFQPGRPVDPLEYPLDELLMVNLLARGRGAEIHACGMVDQQGNGHLFAGQSGAGKTTIARLLQRSEGLTILSDDRIILRKAGERIWMYGTPWHGEARLACPARAPLTWVNFLRHGQKNELVPQRKAGAIARLFACSFPLFYSPEALHFTLGFLEKVVKAVPCYELSFIPDERVVEFLQRLKAKD